jgi:hypothetical protein
MRDAMVLEHAHEGFGAGELVHRFDLSGFPAARLAPPGDAE